MDYGYYQRRLKSLKKSYKCCFFSLVAVALMLLVLLLTGCKSIEYIPVETVRTDTLIESRLVYDSIHVHDSVLVKEKGDTVLIERWHTKIADRWRTDTIYRSRTDSIQVPYPVEKKLTKWQTFCLDYGKIMLGGTVAGVVIALLWFIGWLRRKV